MKKTMQSLLVGTLMAFMLVSCGNKTASSDPKVVLKEFFERLSKKDIEGATKLATKDSKSTLDMMKKGLDMAEKMEKDMPQEKDPAEEFKNVEFGDATINGETATVPVKNKKDGEATTFTLKKEEGAWKVDFSMATLRNMDKSGSSDGLDAMDEEGNEVSAEEIEKARVMMDSMMKNVDPKKLEELKKEMEKNKDQ